MCPKLRGSARSFVIQRWEAVFRRERKPASFDRTAGEVFARCARTRRLTADACGSLALVVRSRADRLARSVGPDTLPYPLLCDADGVLYDLLDIPTRSGALSTYSLEAWQIMRDAKRRGYHSPANGQQQLPLTLVLDKDGTVLFSHYGASLTDVPADCGAAQSLLEDLDVAKPVDVDDADVTIYADPGAAPDIPGLTPHVHEYAQPNLGETGVFSVFDDAYKDEE